MERPQSLPRTPSLLLAAVLALAAACATDPVTGRREYTLVHWSPERERQVGAEGVPGLEVELDGVYADAEAQRVVTELVDELVAHSPRREELDFQVVVLAASEPNALALPGGYVFVTRGLLADVASEAELVAVLGHEIGHVEHRHAMTGSSKGALIGLPAIPFEWLGGVLPIGGRVVGFAGGVLRAPSALVNLKFSREQELEADRRGAFYAYTLGYDPRALRAVFERGYASKGSSILSTHPTDAERSERYDRLLERSYPDALQREPGSFRGTSEAMGALLARCAAEADAYEAFETARELLATSEGEEDLELAWEQLARALDEAPEEPLFWTLAGELALEHEDTRGARLSFLRAERLYRRALGECGHWKPPFYLGVFDLEQGRPARARERLALAASLCPASGALRYYLGLALEAGGEVAEARGAYETALRLAGDDPELRAAIRERLRGLSR